MYHSRGNALSGALSGALRATVRAEHGFAVYGQPDHRQEQRQHDHEPGDGLSAMSDGAGRRVAALPHGAVPNGIAIDTRGDLFVADSFGGLIWRLPPGGGEATAWLRHAWLTPRPLVGRYPGANGLQIAGDAVYVAVSDRGLLLRIPIFGDGNTLVAIVS